ncbi:MAG: endo-1,4-beta-xylanase [Ignavibacteria bacterium]
MKQVIQNGSCISKKVIFPVLFFFQILFLNQVTAQIQTDVPHLKDVYKNDFSIGCLLSYRHVGFPTDPVVPGQSAVVDPNGGYLIQFHMNSMSPGNNMKPQNTVDISASAAAYTAASPGAERDSVDVHPVVRFIPDMIAQLNWAQRQGFTFRGHTLVWHNQTPGTAFFRSGYTAGGTRLSKEKMTERMGNYLKEIIRLLHESWPGLLSAMDVVNEAVSDNGSDRTTNNEWYTTFGDNSYIMKAFELTRQYCQEYGEEQIKLYYNDYSTHISAKADGIVRVCGPIFRAGYLDGIGMQDHDANASPTAAAWIASYNKFDTICTEMAVTELDVNPGSGTPSQAALQTQANQYGVLLKCFVERSYRSGRGKIINVSKDGLNDQHAFVANASLWTSADQCKPAFYSVVDVGLNYNTLDSLILYADTLQEGSYTPESWSNFTAVLASAKNSRDRNYSNSESAGDTLGAAKDILQAAINNLIITGVESFAGSNVKSYSLSQNYPNPFNPSTIIKYSIPQNGYISLKVFDLQGEEVATLSEGVRQAGSYSVTFDASGLANGVYLYQLKSNGFMETKKLLLLK